MVNKSTPLSVLLKSAWKQGNGTTITGILAVDDFMGKNRGDLISLTIGRYTESLIGHTDRKEIDLTKYRLVDGVGDETGRPYLVVAEVLPKPKMTDNERSKALMGLLMKALADSNLDLDLTGKKITIVIQ